MSQFSGGQPEVKTIFTADTTGVEAGAKRAEAAVKTFETKAQTAGPTVVPVGDKSSAAKGKQAGEKDGDAYTGGFIASITRGSRLVRGALGGFGLLFAARQGFAIGKSLADGFIEARNAARAFNDELKALNINDVERLRDVLLEVRVAQKAITEEQAIEAKLRSEQRAAEQELHDATVKRIEQIETLRSRVFETIVSGMTTEQLRQQALEDELKQVNALVKVYDQRIAREKDLLKLARDKADLEERTRRETERQREQAGAMPTLSSPGRVTAALDIIQRQRIGA